MPAPRLTGRLAAGLLVAGLLAAGPLLTAGCSKHGELVLRGSDTMAPLAQAWAESFHSLYPEWDVAVAGGGSGVGLAALLDGTAAIALSSRPAAPAEEAQATVQGLALQSVVAGYDGIAVIVPAASPVEGLTLGQVRQLFSGAIDNWRDLGGPDQAVVLVAREGTSGTHDTFAALVLGTEPLASGALLLPSHRATVLAVAQTPGAIGYVSLAHVGSGVKALALAAEGTGAVAPSAEAIAAGRYSLARPLWLYALDPAPPEATLFLQHVLTPAGQIAVQRAGYVPVQRAGESVPSMGESVQP